MTPRRPEICKRVERYPTVALVLQGGGALGGYQCGVYEGLHDAGIRPNWFAGTSIGAINGAILAGTPPEDRVQRLREFWELISEPAGPLSALTAAVRGTVAAFPEDANLLGWARDMSAMGAMLQGQRGFFEPRMFSPFLFNDGSPQATSFYDTEPLRRTLERFVDFDRINNDHSVRLTVGATGITSGNFRYFDSDRDVIRVEHILASGALPPRSRRWRSRASGTGTAASSPTPRSNSSWTGSRTATPWPCRWTCGAPAARRRAPCPTCSSG